MNPKRPYRNALLILALAVACLGALWRAAAVPAPAAAPPAAVPSALPAFDPLPLAAGFAAAAEDLRARRCGAALEAAARVAPPADGVDPAAAHAFGRTVEGLYAHACEDVERAYALLSSDAASAPVEAASPAAAELSLDDWRLLALADSAAALGRDAVAREALSRLLAEHPRSPLRPRAYRTAARLAAAVDEEPGTGRAGAAAAASLPAGADVAASLGLVRQARGETLPAAVAADLEALAWRIGTATGDAAVRNEAARRLLVDHPQRARDLGIGPGSGSADAGSAPQGSLLPALALSPAERVRRAENLLAAGQPQEARIALAAVPEAARDLEWSLLAARARVAEGEGLEALRLLADAPATAETSTAETPAADPAQAAADSRRRAGERRARLEWHRALAAFEAARVRRGRENLTADERQRLRRQALRHLAAAADPGAERSVAVRALGRLFTELWEEERVEEALAVLTRLREIDPEDLTGTRALWQAGWSQFEKRNPSGAIGYWSELIALYPESAYSRNGRYWTARAHEELGNDERAAAIYREVVAVETVDFYTPYARERLERLASAVALPDREAAPLAEDRGVPWPRHDAFRRARLLSDLGLDALALSEVAAVRAAAAAAVADPRRREELPGGPDSPLRRRAGLALEALVLARQGEPRESIQRIHDAFPSLGGPLQGTVPAEALRLYYPLAHGEIIRHHARRRSLPPSLVLGMVRQESGFDTDAVSHAGARGLMQLMPATGREVAGKLGLPWAPAKLSEPEFNIALGTAYFRQVLSMFDGDVELALAGYNGGPYRIRRLWNEAPPQQGRDVFLEGLPVSESRIYLKRILLLADSYRQLYPSVAAGGERRAGLPAVTGTTGS